MITLHMILYFFFFIFVNQHDNSSFCLYNFIIVNWQVNFAICFCMCYITSSWTSLLEGEISHPLLSEHILLCEYIFLPWLLTTRNRWVLIPTNTDGKQHKKNIYNKQHKILMNRVTISKKPNSKSYFSIIYHQVISSLRGFYSFPIFPRSLGLAAFK